MDCYWFGLLLDFQLSICTVISVSHFQIRPALSIVFRTDRNRLDFILSQIYELIQACSRAMPHVTSTTELPPRIPDFPITDEQRNQVIHELYTTEYTYVKGLEVLVDVSGQTL